MFLHVGADVSVRSKDIVAIIDIGTLKGAAATLEFIQIMKGEGTLWDISCGNPRSFVLTKDKVYLSPISASTLGKRSGSSLDK